MSAEFESLVRPFVDGDTSPARTYFEPGQIGIPNVILRLGRSGSGKTLTGEYNNTETKYMTKYVTERKNPFSPGVATGGAYNFTGKFGQGTIGDPKAGS